MAIRWLTILRFTIAVPHGLNSKCPLYVLYFKCPLYFLSDWYLVNGYRISDYLTTGWYGCGNAPLSEKLGTLCVSINTLKRSLHFRTCFYGESGVLVLECSTGIFRSNRFCLNQYHTLAYRGAYLSAPERSKRGQGIDFLLQHSHTSPA